MAPAVRYKYQKGLVKMGTQKTLKVAIVGLSVGHQGTIGPETPSLIHNFRQMEGVQVVAYCESTKPELLNDAAVHHPGANVYPSVEDLIAEQDFDVASVCLTPRDLPETCIRLAEAGKHFFMDKQFARTSADLAPVVKAVRQNRVKTFLGHPFSFHPAVQDLKRLIDEGILGRPLDIESSQIWWKVGPGGDDSAKAPYRNETEGGGVLHYVGCHHLEIMRTLMGCEVRSVQAMTGRPVGVIEEPLEDVAILAMEFENGAYGSLHTAYTKPKGLGLDGFEGALVYRGLEGWANWPPVAGSTPGWTTMKAFSAHPEWSGAPERTYRYDLLPFVGYGNMELYHRWLESFIHAIRADREPYSTVEDGLKILQCIDAAYESARTGGRVEIKYGL